MFTGIIQEIGTVRRAPGINRPLVVEAGRVVGRLEAGGSVAVDGVCLTAVGLSGVTFTVDVSAETLKCTTLGGLRDGDRVNLEWPLTLAAPLGGHIVQGHVDGVGTVRHIRRVAQGHDFSFELKPPLFKYIVEKGSVAIAGVSLTVAARGADDFDVAVVPLTFENTTLQFLRAGDAVNVEVDVVAKYVERFLSAPRGGLTEGRLRDLGFG